MNESKPYMNPQGYVDPTSKYYIDRMWEEYHKMKEELADTKSKLAQSENYIDEVLKPELQYVKNSFIKLRDELIIAEGQRDQAKMRAEALLVVNNDLARDNETLETERNKWEARARKLLGGRKELRVTRDALLVDLDHWKAEWALVMGMFGGACADRDNWKKKYEQEFLEKTKFRAYNESLVPLIEAAQELENSYHDVYVVNKVRKAYQHIKETWEDTKAR